MGKLLGYFLYLYIYKRDKVLTVLAIGINIAIGVLAVILYHH